MENIDSKEIYELSCKITSETYLYSCQYKIVNLILTCNYQLYKWKIKVGPECDSCGMIDTIEHRQKINKFGNQYKNGLHPY